MNPSKNAQKSQFVDNVGDINESSFELSTESSTQEEHDTANVDSIEFPIESLIIVDQKPLVDVEEARVVQEAQVEETEVEVQSLASPEPKVKNLILTELENIEIEFREMETIAMDKLNHIQFTLQEMNSRVNELKELTIEGNKYSKGARAMLGICFPSMLVAGLALGLGYLYLYPRSH